MLNFNLQGNSVTGIRYSFVGEHWNYGQGCIIHSFIMNSAFVPGFCLGIVYKHILCEKGVYKQLPLKGQLFCLSSCSSSEQEVRDGRERKQRLYMFYDHNYNYLRD